MNYMEIIKYFPIRNPKKNALYRVSKVLTIFLIFKNIKLISIILHNF